MTVGIQEDVVRLDVSVYDVLAVYISQGAAELGDPEPNGIFRKRFS